LNRVVPGTKYSKQIVLNLRPNNVVFLGTKYPTVQILMQQIFIIHLFIGIQEKRRKHFWIFIPVQNTKLLGLKELQKFLLRPQIWYLVIPITSTRYQTRGVQVFQY
jgi:hypothetical protein